MVTRVTQVKPAAGRAKIEEGIRLVITIRNGRLSGMLRFPLTVLVLAAGLYGPSLLPPPPVPLWLRLFPIPFICWYLMTQYGDEMLTADSESLRFARRCFGITMKQRPYARDEIQGIRSQFEAVGTQERKDLQPVGLIETSRGNVKFGLGLDEAELRAIIGKLCGNLGLTPPQGTAIQTPRAALTRKEHESLGTSVANPEAAAESVWLPSQFIQIQEGNDLVITCLPKPIPVGCSLLALGLTIVGGVFLRLCILQRPALGYWAAVIFVMLIGPFMIWALRTGTETIRISGQELEVATQAPGIRRVSKYDLSEVKDLRVNLKSGTINPIGYSYGGRNAILFTYGLSTRGFGDGLTREEAEFALEKLKDRMRE